MTSGSRESVTGWQPSGPCEEFAQPPGTATSVREPNHHLPQPDLPFLDEPAPGLDQLAVDPGRVVVIVFGQAKAQLGSEVLLGSGAIIGSALCYAANIVMMRWQALKAKAGQPSNRLESPRQKK